MSRLRYSARYSLRPGIRDSIRNPDFDGGGIPGRQYLVFLAEDGMADTIGLSGDQYDLVGTDLQTVLFSAPNTPIVFDTWQDLYDALSVLPNFNLLNYMANSTTILIYEDGTSREILNKALRYLKLPEVVVTEYVMDGGENIMDGSEFITDGV